MTRQGRFIFLLSCLSLILGGIGVIVALVNGAGDFTDDRSVMDERGVSDFEPRGARSGPSAKVNLIQAHVPAELRQLSAPPGPLKIVPPEPPKIGSAGGSDLDQHNADRCLGPALAFDPRPSDLEKRSDSCPPQPSSNTKVSSLKKNSRADITEGTSLDPLNNRNFDLNSRKIIFPQANGKVKNIR